MYIFDTNTLRPLFNHFYPERFPTLWRNFNGLVESGKLCSVKEVLMEIRSFYKEDDLLKWANKNAGIFMPPTTDEFGFISSLFKNHHYQQLISARNLRLGKPVADPFLIAKAKALNATLITDEKDKENSAKIPTVCKQYGVACLDLKGFMEEEGWVF